MKCFSASLSALAARYSVSSSLSRKSESSQAESKSESELELFLIRCVDSRPPFVLRCRRALSHVLVREYAMHEVMPRPRSAGKETRTSMKQAKKARSSSILKER